MKAPRLRRARAREWGLWFATDGDATSDGLHYLDLDPAHATTFGRPFRIATAPGSAEVTGPAFNSDMTTLFFNAQGPGTGSTWPRDR